MREVFCNSHCESSQEVGTPISVSPIVSEIINGINSRRHYLFFAFHIKTFVEIANWCALVEIMSFSDVGSCEGVTPSIHNFAISFFAYLKIIWLKKKKKLTKCYYIILLLLRNYLRMNAHVLPWTENETNDFWLALSLLFIVIYQLLQFLQDLFNLRYSTRAIN